jgi:hypothetical protein
LKPLSVTLPFAARFTGGETAGRARKCIQQPSESENRDRGRKGKGETLARFLISLLIPGAVSDQ